VSPGPVGGLDHFDRGARCQATKVRRDPYKACLRSEVGSPRRAAWRGRCLHGSALAWLRRAHRQSALLLMPPLACLEADAYTAWWPPGSQPYCCCGPLALEAMFADAHTSRLRPAPPCSPAVRPAAAVAAARSPSRLALPMSAGFALTGLCPDSLAASLLLRTSLAALLADAYTARLSPGCFAHRSQPLLLLLARP
jgi:hypothetical protein